MLSPTEKSSSCPAPSFWNKCLPDTCITGLSIYQILEELSKYAAMSWFCTQWNQRSNLTFLSRMQPSTLCNLPLKFSKVCGSCQTQHVCRVSPCTKKPQRLLKSSIIISNDESWELWCKTHQAARQEERDNYQRKDGSSKEEEMLH